MSQLDSERYMIVGTLCPFTSVHASCIVTLFELAPFRPQWVVEEMDELLATVRAILEQCLVPAWAFVNLKRAVDEIVFMNQGVLNPHVVAVEHHYRFELATQQAPHLLSAHSREISATEMNIGVDALHSLTPGRFIPCRIFDDPPAPPGCRDINEDEPAKY